MKGRASCLLNPRDVTAAPHLAQLSPRGLPDAPGFSRPGEARCCGTGRSTALSVGLPSFPQFIPSSQSAGVLIPYFKCPNQAMTPDTQAEISLLSQVKVSLLERNLSREREPS